MASPNPNTKMRKGAPSLNPKGRPRGKSGPISRLRGTLNKLKGLEADAIQVISDALEGLEVDKAQLDTAKWVINSLPNYTRAALAEESYKLEVARENDAENKKTGTDDAPVRFTMKMIENDDSDE